MCLTLEFATIMIGDVLLERHGGVLRWKQFQMAVAHIYLLITYNFLPHELLLYTGSTIGQYGDDVTCADIKNNEYMIVECEEDVTCIERGGIKSLGVFWLHISFW